MRKYYKYKRIGHIAKNCQLEQKMKNKSIQDKIDTKKNKQQDFRDSPK